MLHIRWNSLKNDRLKKTRGVSFQELMASRLIAVKEHPARKHQSVLLFEYKSYIWIVPFVVKGQEVFLKTLFPSRKYTKLYKKGAL